MNNPLSIAAQELLDVKEYDGAINRGADYEFAASALNQAIYKYKDHVLVPAEMLRSLKMQHHYCEDRWYSCPKSKDGCINEAQGTDCNCGADKFNEGIDAIIEATKEES